VPELVWGKGRSGGAPDAAAVPRLERQSVYRGEPREEAAVCQGRAQEAGAVHRGGQGGGGQDEEGELVALERKIEMAGLWALEQKMSIIDAQRRCSAAHCVLFLRGLDRDRRSQSHSRLRPRGSRAHLGKGVSARSPDPAPAPALGPGEGGEEGRGSQGPPALSLRRGPGFLLLRRPQSPGEGPQGSSLRGKEAQD